MGIDDLIRILLFAAFFWPVISGLFKKRQSPPKKSAPPRSAPPKTREPRRQPSAERPVTGIPKTGIPKQSQPQSSSNFDTRLEEARKRVREAMESGETDARSAKPQRRTTAKVPTSQPGAERGLFKEPARQTLLSQPRQTSTRQVDVQKLESAPRTFAPAGSMANTMGKTSFGEESDPLKVTRLRSSRRSKGKSSRRSRRGTSQAAPLLDMSATSILRGFVWQQILSEPKAKRIRAKTDTSKASRRTP